jgi:hypothetical protein
MWFVKGSGWSWRRVSDHAGMWVMGIIEDPQHREHSQFKTWSAAEVHDGYDVDEPTPEPDARCGFMIAAAVMVICLLGMIGFTRFLR